MTKPLIIGFGNSLREDDGIGLRAAELVERCLAPDAADIVQCSQLTPELAAQVEGASIVIFLDAAINREPGTVSVTPLHKAEPSAWSHHLSPAQLLCLTDNTSPAYWITCGTSQMGWREKLTAQGEEFAARMAAAALSLLREHALPEHTQHAAAPAMHTMDPDQHP